MGQYNLYPTLENIIDSNLIPEQLFFEMLKSYDLSKDDFISGKNNQLYFSKLMTEKIFKKKNRNFHTIISRKNFNHLTDESKDVPILLYKPLNDHSRQHLEIGDVLFSYRSGQFKDLNEALNMRGIYGLGIALSNPLKIGDEFKGREKYKNYGIIVFYPFRLKTPLSVRDIQLNPDTIDLTPYNGNRNDSLQHIPNEKHYNSLLSMLLFKNPQLKQNFKFLGIQVNELITPIDFWNKHKEKTNDKSVIKDYKELFENWLDKNPSIRPKTADNYISAINTLNRRWNEHNSQQIDIWGNPYFVKDVIGRKTIFDNQHIKELNERQNRTQSSAINYYFEFLEELNKNKVSGINRIYFGAPGTGKSYTIGEFIKQNGIPNYDSKGDHFNVFRITLHPEFSYTDLVGQVMPVVKPIEQDGNRTRIEYQFYPQAFTEALKVAFEYPFDPVFLILEEMSRANVAAVFGDLFQLLDRDENGESEYHINNSLIATELWDDPNKKIYLPNNFFLLGTANTSDQNVFVMDTAFKRRFELEYIDAQDVAVNLQGEPLNNFTFIFKENEHEDITFDWVTLYQTLNSFITAKGENGLGLSEDKQVGQFFIKFRKDDGEYNYNQFRSKLLEYLWNDVQRVTYSDISLFKSEITNFSQAYSSLQNRQNIFSNEFLQSLLIKLGKSEG